MKEYDPDDPPYVSALLDERAEMFTQKRFRHSQSKTQPSRPHGEKDRQTKSPAVGTESVAKGLGKV